MCLIVTFLTKNQKPNKDLTQELTVNLTVKLIHLLFPEASSEMFSVVAVKKPFLRKGNKERTFGSRYHH